ncbi:MAG: polymerase sigma-70 factor, subfamily [Hydrocarboniphaga sp.]|nr:polymerase sigma-70 factor, subfamily [Hydrocarboniphaga sp.]
MPFRPVQRPDSVLLPGIRSELEALFREHHVRLVRFLSLRLGSREEAQEAAQEAYIRLLQREGSPADDNIRALLYVTARNIAIDRLRERRRHGLWAEAQLQASDAESGHDAATPERIVAGQQQLGRLQRLIQDLPPKCRYAFIRYKFHGSDYAIIAGELGLTESMVRKYVLKAVAYCALHLDAKDAL